MQLPARIGKYELQEFIGGGMARVYKAQDTVIGRTVAVKILTEEGCADPDAKSRFLQEARLAGNIAHDNIISIYDFGEDDQGRPFMVMEFLRGEDLRHAIKGGKTGHTRERLATALQIARALEHIHSQKIIHRDIKPDNVFITLSGTVKLMDFGISKLQNSTKTSTGIVMGTPYYMAPEQVLGKNVTEQVDVYAFGVMLFELMSGERPLTGDSVERLFYAILNEPLDLAPLRTMGVPEIIVDLIARCTEKEPAKRPQGFGDVCTRIQNILKQLDTQGALPTAPMDAPKSANSKPWLIPVAVLGLLAVAAIGYFALRPKAAAPPATAPIAATPSVLKQLPKTLADAAGDMVLVPAGEFLFGADKTVVTLPAFYIDKTEVTVDAYQRFCNMTGHKVPEGMAREHPDYPVTDVTIDDARDFAKWAGKRLPTMQEWEKAARGTDGRAYPWGAERDPARANVADNSELKERGLSSAASFEKGASVFGALGLVGNVWEWVDDRRTPSAEAIRASSRMNPPPTADEPWYAMRGGSYAEKLQDGVLYDVATVPGRYHNKTTGFRCAKTP